MLLWLTLKFVMLPNPAALVTHNVTTFVPEFNGRLFTQNTPVRWRVEFNYTTGFVASK